MFCNFRRGSRGRGSDAGEDKREGGDDWDESLEGESLITYRPFFWFFVFLIERLHFPEREILCVTCERYSFFLLNIKRTKGGRAKKLSWDFFVGLLFLESLLECNKREQFLMGG